MADPRHLRHRPRLRADDAAADDTVRMAPPTEAKPPLLSRRAALVGGGVFCAACLAGGLGALMWSRNPAPSTPATPTPAAPPVATPTPTLTPAPAPPAPAFAIQSASEPEILDHTPTALTVFRFAPAPRILVLDFPTLLQQGLMLNRVAALIEKSGAPRERVLNTAELDAAISAGGDTVATYYYGHDYSAASLQRFFALADGEKIALGDEESRLRQLLNQEGWFAEGVQAGLISIPAIGADALVTRAARATILHHELSHGEFFSDPGYADYVHQFWNTGLSADERAGVRRFLGSLGYDTSYEELVYNEMQAYLMFTRDPLFFTPDRVGLTVRRLADLQDRFLRGMPRGWLRDALAATPVNVSEAAPRQ
jgi:hypothetical protein